MGAGPQVTVNNTVNGSGGTVAIYGTAPQGSWGNVGFASTDNRYHVVENLSKVSGAPHSEGRHGLPAHRRDRGV